MNTDILQFQSDYQEACHENILKRLTEEYRKPYPGYGSDSICEAAKEKIRKTCQCPTAQVEFLVGGTQTNATVIDSFLPSYQGILCADSGHIAVHEAGAIELTRHKVLPLKGKDGKLSPKALEAFLSDFALDENKAHTVQPGMVYLSQPTEYGSLYSKAELTAISELCKKHRLLLFVDGARLAYALAAPENDIKLPDLARLCDVFYIGGTKCGAMFGEAVVIPDSTRLPHFFTSIKQHGALIAKGWLLGLQFDELFKDELYLHIGEKANAYAREIKATLKDAGLPLFGDYPTNQVFFVISHEKMEQLKKQAQYAYMERYDENSSVIRFCTSWSTREEDVKKCCEIIRGL